MLGDGQGPGGGTEMKETWCITQSHEEAENVATCKGTQRREHSSLK